MDNIFFENDLLDEPKQMPPSKKVLSFQEAGKMVIKIEFTPLSLRRGVEVDYWPIKAQLRPLEKTPITFNIVDFESTIDNFIN